MNFPRVIRTFQRSLTLLPAGKATGSTPACDLLRRSGAEPPLCDPLTGGVTDAPCHGSAIWSAALRLVNSQPAAAES